MPYQIAEKVKGTSKLADYTTKKNTKGKKLGCSKKRAKKFAMTRI